MRLILMEQVTYMIYQIVTFPYSFQYCGLEWSSRHIQGGLDAAFTVDELQSTASGQDQFIHRDQHVDQCLPVMLAGSASSVGSAASSTKLAVAARSSTGDVAAAQRDEVPAASLHSL